MPLKISGNGNLPKLCSDSGGEQAAVQSSLNSTCRLNNVESKKWLYYIIEYIEEWPTNRGRDLLSGKVGLTEK